MIIGKNAIITGGSQGLGFVIAKRFVREGVNICVCARNEKQLINAIDELNMMKENDGQKVCHISCDIGDVSQIDRLYEFAVNELGTIDIVVNNAGIYGPFGRLDELDWALWEEAVRINLLGTVYSMRKAVEVMKKKNTAGKIINLSGGGATSPMPNISSYAATKAAVIRMTETIALENKEYGIDINAIAPGALNTRLLDQVLAAGREVVGDAFYEKSLRQRDNGGAPIDNAADLVVYLADDVSNGITGKLISAVWDDWKHLHEHKQELSNSDLYTLRRIAE